VELEEKSLASPTISFHHSSIKLHSNSEQQQQQLLLRRQLRAMEMEAHLNVMPQQSKLSMTLWLSQSNQQLLIC